MYALCIWRCEHARFCVEVFYALYINFHAFIFHRRKEKGRKMEREGGGGGEERIEGAKQRNKGRDRKLVN